MNPNFQTGGTMDATGSLRKVANELMEILPGQPDALARLEAASWLITYIADCIDVELQHAVDRGRQIARKQIEQDNKEYALEDREYPSGPNGVKDYGILNGDNI
jgi:hypothetical protein